MSYQTPGDPFASQDTSRQSSFLENDASAGLTDNGPQEWQIGDRLLDLYEVTAVLGEGGMGKVYKVHHNQWSMDLAVKSPRRDLFAWASGKANFIHEAETWVNLGLHPHIVSCYYVRTIDDIPRIFAEYVPGESVAEWLHQRHFAHFEPVRILERLLDIAIQFAWGLHAAHEQGLVHQDVKLANVMLSIDGTVKVTDFGLAKARAVSGEFSRAEAGQSLLVSVGGTPAYCSPEQASRRPLTYKTDIWSWAVSVLEMFVGKVTWMSGTLAGEALADYLRQAPADQALPLMPTDLARLLEQCFQLEPQKRPTNMAEIATSLLGIYSREVGQPYLRDAPQLAVGPADTLNNKALSFYDLGKIEEAMQMWEQALQADPHHLETTFNQGVVLWREGKLTDDELVQRVQAVQAAQHPRWEAFYILSLIHMERGDREAALAEVVMAAQLAPTTHEIKELLMQIKSSISSQRSRTLQKEGQRITTVILSDDGHLALSGGNQGHIQVWDTATSQCLQTLKEHTGSINAVSLSGDGSLALSCDTDGAVLLWETRSGHCLHKFHGHTQAVHAVSLSTDGHLALTASNDGTVQLWESATGQHLGTFASHVRAVSLNGDGSLALFGGVDGRLQLWDTRRGQCLFRTPGKTLSQLFGGDFELLEGITAVSLSHDGSYALTGGNAYNGIELWDFSRDDPKHVLYSSGRSLFFRTSITSVGLSSDKRWALAGSTDGYVRLWETTTGRCLRTIRAYPGKSQLFTPAQASLSADGRLILVGSEHGVLQLWERTDNTFCSFRLSRGSTYTEITQAEQQTALLLQQAKRAYAEQRYKASLDMLCEVRKQADWTRKPESLELWRKLSRYCTRVELQASHLLNTYQKTGGLLSVSEDERFAMTGTEYLASGRGGDSGRVELWEIATGQNLWECKLTVEAIDLSADGHVALIGGHEMVEMRDSTRGLLQATFESVTHWWWPKSLWSDIESSSPWEWFRDRLHMLVLNVGERGRWLRWLIYKISLIPYKQGHIGFVNAVKMSTDGRWIISGGSEDQAVRLWEVATGRCLRIFEGHKNYVTSISLSADGRWIASGSWDSCVRLWEIATGRCLHVFKGHTDFITSVNLSADGQWLVSSSRDGTVKLWDTTIGYCLRTFQASKAQNSQHRLLALLSDENAINTAVLSTDERWIIAGGNDCVLRLWEVATGKCVRSFEGHRSKITSVHLSADMRLIISIDDGGNVMIWELDWELEAHDIVDWDDGAHLYLETFLAQHTPYVVTSPIEGRLSKRKVQRALTRQGRPAWTEEDFQGLIRQLQNVGYGWLRPGGVRRKLVELAAKK